jgi:hypothetical protein
MLIYFLIAILMGIVIGWAWKDYKWTKAAKTKKVVCVDGIFYKVSIFNPEGESHD